MSKFPCGKFLLGRCPHQGSPSTCTLAHDWDLAPFCHLWAKGECGGCYKRHYYLERDGGKEVVKRELNDEEEYSERSNKRQKIVVKNKISLTEMNQEVQTTEIKKEVDDNDNEMEVGTVAEEIIPDEALALDDFDVLDELEESDHESSKESGEESDSLAEDEVDQMLEENVVKTGEEGQEDIEPQEKLVWLLLMLLLILQILFLNLSNSLKPVPFVCLSVKFTFGLKRPL